MDRRSFLKKGTIGAIGTALLRGGVQAPIDWAKRIEEAILEDPSWYSFIMEGAIPRFLADIQKVCSLETFVKLKGIGYMAMEFDDWSNDPEFVEGLQKALEMYIRFLGGAE